MVQEEEKRRGNEGGGGEGGGEGGVRVRSRINEDTQRRSSSIVLHSILDHQKTKKRQSVMIKGQSKDKETIERWNFFSFFPFVGCFSGEARTNRGTKEDNEWNDGHFFSSSLFSGPPGI